MALPQAPLPQQPDLPVHPQDQSIGTLPIAPPELRARVRAKMPLLALVGIVLAILAAIYWTTMPDREKTEPTRSASELSR